MQGHFSAFSLVDRITELEAGKRAKGYFDVPAHVTRFPISFAAEAAGQLAAWASMVHLDFGLRPVAGVAADLRFGIPVRPGKRLELETTIGHLDTEAVRYSARASIEGVSVIELDHSVGPMLPMEGFDSPQAMRERFELIRGKGAPAGRFTDVPEHDLEIVELVHPACSQRSAVLQRSLSASAGFSRHDAPRCADRHRAEARCGVEGVATRDQLCRLAGAGHEDARVRPAG
jgi:3-hydroxymyristoyl/3-hydroxydecanoyl-(acyl carrier protein) dehydratase